MSDGDQAARHTSGIPARLIEIQGDRETRGLCKHQQPLEVSEGAHECVLYQPKKHPSASKHSPSLTLNSLRQKVMLVCMLTTNLSNSSALRHNSVIMALDCSGKEMEKTGGSWIIQVVLHPYKYHGLASSHTANKCLFLCKKKDNMIRAQTCFVLEVIPEQHSLVIHRHSHFFQRWREVKHCIYQEPGRIGKMVAVQGVQHRTLQERC